MRRRLIACLGFFAALGIAPDEAVAADIRINQTVEGDDYISISGKITRDDVQKFVKASEGTGAEVVFLDSPGGSINAAIEIGRIIRTKRLRTIVADDNYCVSACGLIWLAGERRLLTPEARVGFHAAYVIEGGLRLESVSGNSLVERYMTRLDLPWRAFAFAISAGPDSINWLDQSNSEAFGIALDILSDTIHCKQSQALAIGQVSRYQSLARGSGTTTGRCSARSFGRKRAQWQKWPEQAFLSGSDDCPLGLFAHGDACQTKADDHHRPAGRLGDTGGDRVVCVDDIHLAKRTCAEAGINVASAAKNRVTEKGFEIEAERSRPGKL